MSTEARLSVLVAGDSCAGTGEVVLALFCTVVTAIGCSWVNSGRDEVVVAVFLAGGMANHSYLLLSLSHLGTWSPFWIRYWNVGSPRRLLQKPQLQVARIVQTFPTKVINDMDTPGGKRIITWDPTVKLLETISEAMNFTTYSDVFKPELQQQPQSPPKHGVYHRIKTSGPPVFSKFRRLAFDKFAAAKRTFKLERLGICQKAISSWAFPLHIVTKKDCSLRPCGDYRCLNTKRSQTTTHFPTSPTTPPSSTVPESSQNWTC
ncbi:hypothetical protein Pcinc_009170 [Petrolisthes cinctipes]|uniref:Uncharacterized protein n=1 Tax=Petrolisthes cinctipes TaxID=88211 RepID=A0AAE1KVT1_PETCI|nr:hypothetical protein Pcinc_009170 [Petrolisthes cinctipes]